MWASLLLRKKPVRIVSRRVDFSIFRHNFLGMNRYKYTKGADHIVAVAHKVKDVLIQDGIPPEKISVVHSGADMDRFRGKTGGLYPQRIGFIRSGSNTWQCRLLGGPQRPKHLIQAMTKVVSKIPGSASFDRRKRKIRKRIERPHCPPGP